MRLRGCPSHKKFARLLSANIEMRIASSLGSVFKENGGQFQTGSSTCMLQKRLASHVLPCVKKRWQTPTENDGWTMGAFCYKTNSLMSNATWVMDKMASKWCASKTASVAACSRRGLLPTFCPV